MDFPTQSNNDLLWCNSPYCKTCDPRVLLLSFVKNDSKVVQPDASSHMEIVNSIAVVAVCVTGELELSAQTVHEHVLIIGIKIILN